MKDVITLIEKISVQDQFQEQYLKGILDTLTDLEKHSLADIISFFKAQGFDLDYQTRAYILIVQDTMKEQKYFFDHKKYRYSTYKEVAGHVYDDPEYMRLYMVGLILSQYFWNIHRSMMRHFREITKGVSGKKYLEIGPGHGQYFADAMQNMHFDEFLAVDVSATSVEMTKAFVAHTLKNSSVKYDVIHKNFFDFDDSAQFDAVVMGEVLEHVEDPLSFLKKIRSVASENAFIYITTVINAPAIDHIYLFRNRDEVLDVVNRAGLSVVSYKEFTPQPSISVEKAIRKEYPIDIALILKR
ncbi:MAG: class I SAM-dependent methyltransferase [Deferribacteraceae bacterium]|jgi:2-polyprenyl-3-methyl-5-hydroxy-6-metoxy-1,4-benzoquinol methylase|nr:class I SAM-dependent methyltransferase [Deferribacteraceae bacterium]